MADFNINSHLQNMGFGRGKQDAGGDSTNEKDTIQALIDDAGGKTTGTLSKLTGMPNLTQLGSISIAQPFESEGVSGKMIMPSVLPDAQGGFLAKLLHSIFVKNREITDHTQGVSGDGGGGGSGGGSFAAGGDGGGFAENNFASLVGASGSYSYADIPMENIGSLRPYAPGGGGAAIELS